MSSRTKKMGCLVVKLNSLVMKLIYRVMNISDPKVKKNKTERREKISILLKLEIIPRQVINNKIWLKNKY